MRYKKKCTFPECNKILYARGYCRNHYNVARRNNDFENVIARPKLCTFPGCNKHIRLDKKYCAPHERRVERAIIKGYDPFQTYKKGENHYRWRGGKSYYPNHYIFKKMRLLKLQLVKGNCELCGKSATYVIHINNDNADHDLSNLQALCKECFIKKRLQSPERTSKYKQEYGFTIAVLCIILNMCAARVIQLHKKGELKKRLRDRLWECLTSL